MQIVHVAPRRVQEASRSTAYSMSADRETPLLTGRKNWLPFADAKEWSPSEGVRTSNSGRSVAGG